MSVVTIGRKMTDESVNAQDSVVIGTSTSATKKESIFKNKPSLAAIAEDATSENGVRVHAVSAAAIPPTSITMPTKR